MSGRADLDGAGSPQPGPARPSAAEEALGLSVIDSEFGRVRLGFSVAAPRGATPASVSAAITVTLLAAISRAADTVTPGEATFESAGMDAVVSPALKDPRGPVESCAWVVRRDREQLTVRGEVCSADGARLARGECTFVLVRRARVDGARRRPRGAYRR